MPDKLADDPVVLTSYPTEPSAAIALATLNAAGIKATLSGAITSAFRAEAIGEVQILVRRGDLARAREALANAPNDRI